MQKPNRYIYEGPVMVFDRCVASDYKCETVAVSEKKARTNITYQVKSKLNLIPGSKVTLPGKIKMV